MFTFGQRLKKLRQEQCFSQSYLAENIGVSIQSVSNWECDTTMPDISQIVPLASILGVSTDFLLGNDCNETVDIEKLEEEVKRIWATYSVNTSENNADYMVCELYRGFLRKYPLNYEIKYKCALALHDYLVVSAVRHKFEISQKDFNKLFSECEKLLWAICKYDLNLQRQIEARSLLVQHYTLNHEWEKALETADTLPDTCGIKQDNIRTIAQCRRKFEDAQDAAIQSSRFKCQEYVMSLFHRAKCISDNENNGAEEVLQAWKDMIDASEMFVTLFKNLSEPGVNTYEQNPFCYLITAYSSMCNTYLCYQDLEKALSCLEKATDAAIKLYTWGRERGAEKLAMEDIIFFVKHTPGWCHNKAPESIVNSFTSHPRYITCEERVEAL